MADFSKLVALWQRRQAAIHAMVNAGRPLAWPGDPLRDAVQGWGGAFAAEWRRLAPEITEYVRAGPAEFPLLHVPDRKTKALPDPTEYANKHIVMQELCTR